MPQPQYPLSDLRLLWQAICRVYSNQTDYEPQVHEFRAMADAINGAPDCDSTVSITERYLRENFVQRLKEQEELGAAKMGLGKSFAKKLLCYVGCNGFKELRDKHGEGVKSEAGVHMVPSAKTSRLSMALLALLLLSNGLWLFAYFNGDWVSITEAGNFNNPTGNVKTDLMGDIAREVQKADASSVLIISDLVSYGIFSYPQKFDEYYAAILKASEQVKVNIISLDSSGKRQLLANQFENTRIDPQKLNTYLDRELVKIVFDQLADSAKTLIRSGQINDHKDVWVDFFEKVDHSFAEDLGKNTHIEVLEYPFDLPVHFWSGTDKSAVVSFVNYKNRANETGFLFHFAHNRNLIDRLFQVFYQDQGAKK